MWMDERLMWIGGALLGVLVLGVLGVLGRRGSAGEEEQLDDDPSIAHARAQLDRYAQQRRKEQFLKLLRWSLIAFGVWWFFGEQFAPGSRAVRDWLWEHVALYALVPVLGWLSHSVVPDSKEKGFRNWKITWLVMGLTGLGVLLFYAREGLTAFAASHGLGLREVFLGLPEAMPIIEEPISVLVLLLLLLFAAADLRVGGALHKYVVGADVLIVLWILGQA